MRSRTSTVACIAVLEAMTRVQALSGLSRRWCLCSLRLATWALTFRSQGMRILGRTTSQSCLLPLSCCMGTCFLCRSPRGWRPGAAPPTRPAALTPTQVHAGETTGVVPLAVPVWLQLRAVPPCGTSVCRPDHVPPVCPACAAALLTLLRWVFVFAAYSLSGWFILVRLTRCGGTER